MKKSLVAFVLGLSLIGCGSKNGTPTPAATAGPLGAFQGTWLNCQSSNVDGSYGSWMTISGSTVTYYFQVPFADNNCSPNQIYYTPDPTYTGTLTSTGATTAKYTDSGTNTVHNLTISGNSISDSVNYMIYTRQQ